ncbi:MAG TPA: hypothetical protein VF070_48720 [Streptosporangiaceae bacterium]
MLEDDVIPAGDLIQQVCGAVRARPHQALAFFAEWGSRTSMPLRAAALCGHRWVEVVDFYVPTQALVLPADVAYPLHEYMSALPEDTPNDHALHSYLQKARAHAWVSVPNLVEHNDAVSLVGNQSHGLRRSACLVGDESTTPWQDGPALTDLAVFPYFSWWDLAAECWVRQGQISDWRRMPAETLVNSAGLSDESIHRMIQEDETPTLATLVPSGILRDLWISAFSLGILAVRCKSTANTGVMRDVGEAVPHAALASLAPGALRRLIDPGKNPQVFADLTPFTESAVLRGVKWAKSANAMDNILSAGADEFPGLKSS